MEAAREVEVVEVVGVKLVLVEAMAVQQQPSLCSQPHP